MTNRSTAVVFVTVLLAYVDTGASQQPSAVQQASGPGHYATVNGYRMYYEEYGSGRPLVLLHGGANTIHSSFENQIAEFAKGHHVIAPEQIGHGHTADVADRPFSYRQMAEDTATLLEQLNIRDADLVGWSDGGDVALLIARHHPTLVRRLVISGANIRPEGITVIRRLRELSDEDLSKGLPAAWREAYEPVSPDGPAHWTTFIAKSRAMWLTPVILGTADLAAIQASTLVVSGDKDSITLEHTVEIFRALPHAQLLILPGTPHATFQSAARWLNPMMLEFLDKS
jgi:pimeloyl-ACP methyl ester carboxylesterase